MAVWFYAFTVLSLMKQILYDINYPQVAMMRTPSKKVYNALVFAGINHLIVKHELSSACSHRNRSYLLKLGECLWQILFEIWCSAFPDKQAVIVNNTKQSSPVEVEWLVRTEPRMSSLIQSSQRWSYRSERMLKSKLHRHFCVYKSWHSLNLS